MEKVDGMSMDIEQAERNKLQSLFPQCFKEGKLDIDMLLNLCGEYIDEDFEKYKFEWKGKAECFRIAGKRSTGTLRPCQEESVNFDTTKNLYIEGDNLEVLKLLQTAYFRKIKMIYIDPPYNTGNDFVYNDDFSDPIAHYKEITNQATKSNPESMGRFHTAWLNMMYPRLRLAANLLRDDGVIFISIDDGEVVNLSKICDEIFGEENLVARIPWQSRQSMQNDTDISVNHEYVIVYAKRRRVENRRLKESNSDTWYVQDSFACHPLPLNAENFSNPDSDPRGSWKADPFDAPNVRPNLTYPITNPNTGDQHLPPSGRHWRTSQERFSSALADNRIVWGKNGTGRPQLKVFYNEKKDFGSVENSWFNAEKVGTTTSATKALQPLFNGNAPFDTPKPITLLTKLMTLAGVRDNDIVLDFFGGSSSTAHAVMQLNAEDGGNRRFIMVQLPEQTENKEYPTICEIGKERIRRAGNKILTELQEKQSQIEIGENDEQSSPDIGFKVLKLDTSNLHAWGGTPISDNNLQTLWDRFDAREKTIKPDRFDLDVVFEVMLKLGICLDYVVSGITVGDRKCYSIGEKFFETNEDCMILVCLDFGITPEDMTAFCNLAPTKIVAAEEAFADSTAMSNAHYILRDRDIEMKLL